MERIGEQQDLPHEKRHHRAGHRPAAKADGANGGEADEERQHERRLVRHMHEEVRPTFDLLFVIFRLGDVLVIQFLPFDS